MGLYPVKQTWLPATQRDLQEIWDVTGEKHFTSTEDSADKENMAMPGNTDVHSRTVIGPALFTRGGSIDLCSGPPVPLQWNGKIWLYVTKNLDACISNITKPDMQTQDW